MHGGIRGRAGQSLKVVLPAFDGQNGIAQAPRACTPTLHFEES